jgi:ATP-dependent Clp protease ATP-binding subunit ClpX
MSKILDLPMVICDCNALTQAGYIGQDVESCIQRLLIESGLNVQKAQRGIVVLDEFDKLAKKETTIGRDVAGEGVQQALLAMVHGSKITVNIKDAQKPAQPHSTAPHVPPSMSATLSSFSSASKVDQQFVVDTSNIIFVFCGAFAGLEKIINKRVSKKTMGFKSADQAQPTKESVAANPVLRPTPGQEPPPEAYFDLATPEDLQVYGIIPELLGRIHDICALHPLSLDELYRILTEPRNNLVAQYRALFETYPSEVFFTKKALRAIAKRAADSKKGARGLQSEMLRVLQDAMFIAPVPYILVTAACVEDPNKLHYWGKDGRMELERVMREEDGEDIQPLHVEQAQAQAALGC